MFNRERNTARYKWVILVLVCIGIFSPSYAQYQVSALGKRLMQELSLSDSMFSAIMTSPQIPGAVFSLISGLLVDRFGARKIGLCCVFVAMAGTILRIWANSYLLLYITMISLGFLSTYMNSNSAKILGGWFSPTQAGVMMGAFLAFSNAGMALGTGTGALYPSTRAAFIGAAVIAVAVFVIWLVFMRDARSADGEKETPAPMKECLLAAVRSKGIWLAALGLMMVCTAGVAVSIFLPTALQERGISEQASGIYAMMVTIGGMVSCFITPTIAKKSGRPKLVILILGLIGAVCVALSWRAPEGFLLGFALFMTGFTTTGLSPLLMSVPITLKEIGPRRAGTAGGFVATVQLLGCVVIPTYILTPIAGGNFNLLFGLFAVLMVLFCIISQFVPSSSMQ